MFDSSRLATSLLIAGLLLASPLAHAQTAGEPIAFGTPVSVDLTASDLVFADRNAYYRPFTFVGRAGQRIEMRVASEEIDTYGVLFDPNGVQIAADDDGGGNLDSRILMTLTTDGVYTAYATTYSALTPGNVTIIVSEYVERPISTSPTSIGSVVELTLDETDGELLYGARGEILTFEGRMGQEISVSASSGSFAPFVRLVGPTFESVTEAYSYAVGSSAQFTATLPTTGTFSLLVTNNASYISGPVTVTISEGSELPPSGSELRAGRATDSSIDESDPLDYDSTGHGESWYVNAEAGKVVTVQVTSDVLDAYLRVFDQYGSLVAENDNSNELNPEVSYLVQPNNTYRIEVSDVYTNVGPYSIEATVGDPPPFDPDTVRIGASVTGSIGPTDTMRADGGRQDVYYFEGDAGDEVSFNLSSTTGATLSVVAPTGEVLNGGSAIAYEDYPTYPGNGYAGVLPLSGRYILNVSGWPYGAALDYTLVVSEGLVSSVGEPYALGQSVSGVLSPTDNTTNSYGAYLDRYTVEVGESSLYEFGLDTSSYDMTLSVVDHTGIAVMSTYASGVGPVQASGVLSPGTYNVEVSSYSAYSDMPYTITSRTLPIVEPTIVAITPGVSANGHIDSNSGRTMLGQPGAFFRYTAAAGTTYTFNVSTQDMALSFTVYDQQGNYLTSGYGNSDPTYPITLTTSTSGDLMVVFTTTSPSSDFTLTVR